MRKMPCLFVRDFSSDPFVITPVVSEGCDWVLAGEGRATRKWDGTATLIREGKLFARYDCKKGKTPPPGFEACDLEPDPITGHWPGWIEVVAQPEYKWHREAFQTQPNLPDGTYELCGPKIGGNAERLEKHQLIRHGDGEIPPLLDFSFEGLRVYLQVAEIEGIVFHHLRDHRMAKIRRDDFGFSWPIKST